MWGGGARDAEDASKVPRQRSKPIKKNTFFKDWLFIRNTFFNEMRTFLNRRGEGVFPHERFPLPGVPRARRAPPRVRRDERRSREDHG